MAWIIVQLIYVFTFPYLTQLAGRKTKVIHWISPIATCYIVGIIIGNIPGIHFNQDLLTTISGICIGLALPLLLFSSDILQWLKHSKWTFISFFIACVAVLLAATISFLIFHSRIDNAWKVAGMMVGLYTGSTANMAAVSMALEVDDEMFIILNSTDLIITGTYFFFLMAFSKKFFGLFLPPFKGYKSKEKVVQPIDHKLAEVPTIREKLKDFFMALGLSALIFAVTYGLSLLVFGKILPSFLILFITTFGILASFSPRVRDLKSSYASGEYLLLIFAVSAGSLASISGLLSADLNLIAFFLTGVVGSVSIHLLISYFFRIDTDTYIITSTAALYGPAFIVPVAEGIKNREVIISGLAMALLGNAIGNYLGIGMAHLLNYLV